MDEFNDLMRLRAEKAEALRTDGINPYANDFRVSHALAAVRAAGEPLDAATLEAQAADGSAASWRVAGRVIALRSFGKAAFLKLRDRSGDLQVMVRKDVVGEEAFAKVFGRVDLGDIVGVAGTLFRTKTVELTVLAREFRLLSKSIRPLPEKWHGLQDKETRFRQRYVDLIVNPDVRRIFDVRARAVRHIRSFFDARGYLEVETPMMHVVAGGAAARPFKTFHNALGIPLYLRIAPELYLKRLVVGGLERVYEINRNFRNEGLSQRHNPEFTMLEFYQAYATFEDLMELTEELLSGLVQEVTGGTTLTWGEHTIDFARPWKRLPVAEALVNPGGLDPGVVRDRHALRAALAARGVETDADESLGKLQMLAFETLAESQLVQPTFLTHFPVEVSPLSRRNDADPTIVDRFELYVGATEIANAFSELNDPVDQKGRFEAQLALKAKGDEEAHDMDLDYVRALEYGLPPTAGEGIGIDRLVMLLTDQQSIREVILFPHMRPELTVPAPGAAGVPGDGTAADDGGPTTSGELPT
jgi:lysyl-tRNA synthetase class 2